MKRHDDQENIDPVVALIFTAFWAWALFEFIPNRPQPLYQITASEAQRYWGRN